MTEKYLRVVFQAPQSSINIDVVGDVIVKLFSHLTWFSYFFERSLGPSLFFDVLQKSGPMDDWVLKYF